MHPPNRIHLADPGENSWATRVADILAGIGFCENGSSRYGKWGEGRREKRRQPIR